MATLAARHLAGALSRVAAMASAASESGGIQRTITGSRMDLSELESIINGAIVRDRETDTSSVASSSQTGRSNIIQVCLTGGTSVKVLYT